MNSTLVQQAEIATQKSEKLIVKFQHLIENWGVPDGIIMFTRVSLSIVIIFLAAYLIKKLVDVILVRIIHQVAGRTKTDWDDFLVQRKVFKRLSNLIPAIIAYHLFKIALADVDTIYYEIIQTLIRAYSVFIVVWSVDAFLSAANDMYQTTEMSKERSIKGYIQLGKIIAYIFGVIIIIAILINKNPGSIILGLGTFTAVLMLVFKDTILGLVASVQLSANDLIKIGDWIEMPSRGIDGVVMDISLTSVKVQNWDFSINSIPTYSLVSESFQNWRGMALADGRRFKNSIYVDVNTVRLCTDELLSKLEKFTILRGYLDEVRTDISRKEAASQGEHSIEMSGRPSNLNLFRKYVELSLRNNPNINQDLALVVRYQITMDRGIPVEYVCFSRKKELNDFEDVKAGILEHLWSVLPEFNLSPFQNPTGNDFRKMVVTEKI